MFSFFSRRREQKRRKIREIADQLHPKALWLAKDVIKGQGIDIAYLKCDQARGYFNGYFEGISSQYKRVLGREGTTVVVMSLFDVFLGALTKRNRQNGSETPLISQEPARFYLESCARQMDDSFKEGFNEGQRDASASGLIKTSLLSERYIALLRELFKAGQDAASRDKMLIGLLKIDLGPGLPIASGNGTSERPFLITEETDYVSVEYVVARHSLSMLREEFELENTSLLVIGDRRIDKHNYRVRTTGNSPQEGTRTFFFDITKGFRVENEVDPPIKMPFNPAPFM